MENKTEKRGRKKLPPSEKIKPVSVYELKKCQIDLVGLKNLKQVAAEAIRNYYNEKTK
jgi:hypothetical protein